MMNLLEEAIIYATVMYQGKIRKIRETPFVLHPLEVAQILSTLTDDIDVIAAGVLHDVVEDTDGTLEEIEKRFGHRVAELVDAETEARSPGEDKTRSWEDRKKVSLDKLRNTDDIGVKMLWLADKLSNIRSFASAYGELGDKMWDRFNQKDPLKHLQYYRSVAEYIEMDLNKTGAFKEFVDRINYIWPGTFDSSKAKYKKYREISLDGCKIIGRGKKSEVYRYDDELIVKVYNSLNTYIDVENEIKHSRKAFIMGLPTAISFGIISVGSRYGAMFELIDAKTISELISKNTEHVDYYARVMAELALKIHQTEQEPDSDFFPDTREKYEDWCKRAFFGEDEELSTRFMALIDAMPKSSHMIHGDFHTGNVFLVKDEPLFIDVDRMSVGDPIYDISCVYWFYSGILQYDPESMEKFMGFSAETGERFYDSFIRRYMNTDDSAVLETVKQKSELIGSIRYIGQIKEHASISSEDKERINQLLNKVKALLDTVDSLSL